jgi:hypothetical protein
VSSRTLESRLYRLCSNAGTNPAQEEGGGREESTSRQGCVPTTSPYALELISYSYQGRTYGWNRYQEVSSSRNC